MSSLSSSRSADLRLWGLAGVAALWAAGCTEIPIPAPAGNGIGGASQYVGSSVCQRCHTEVHALWSKSKHASALDTLRDSGDQNNPACLPCHTTGYGGGGFVSLTGTPGLAGVQCESCHGPAGKHVGTRNPNDIIRMPGTPICGNCHTGSMQPEHDEWAQSAHAQALAVVRADPSATDACLQCHSTDYLQAVRNNEILSLRGLPTVPLPGLSASAPGGAAVDSVGCASCHDPHGSNNLSQLRMPPNETCSTCHTDPNPTPGIAAHAPQHNLLFANGGLQLSTDAGVATRPLTGVPSTHSNLDPIGGCAKCHGLVARVAAPTADSPNLTGHRFEIDFGNCGPCHTPDEASNALADRKMRTLTRLGSLRAAAAAKEQPIMDITSRARLNAAKLNLDLIDRDRSFGAHNSGYTDVLLDAAQNLINAVPNPS